MTGMSEVVQFTSVNERVLQREECVSYMSVCISLHLFFLCVHVWVYLSGNETLDRRVIDSENLQINSWTAGAEEIRSEARAAWSSVRQAPEQTVISGL